MAPSCGMSRHSAPSWQLEVQLKEGAMVETTPLFCLLNCHLFLGFQNWMMNDKAVKRDGPGNSL